MKTFKELLEEIAKEKKYTFISTGMSEMKDIENAVKIFNEKEVDELTKAQEDFNESLKDTNGLLAQGLLNKLLKLCIMY